MELQTVRQVSKNYGVSARMLRYYEQAGLLESSRRDDYAYRIYDEVAIQKLQQIIVLRKLQIPIKQIGVILKNQNAVEAIEIFKQNMSEIDEKMTALSTVKSILARFVDELREKADIQLKLDLLNDESMIMLVDSLSIQISRVDEKSSMNELQQASATLGKLEDKDVRIIYVPPATVASIHFMRDEQGRAPEDQGGDIIDAFVKELSKIKPDCRHYGFNHGMSGGYERWFTIPDDMEVPHPFVKKQFAGGVYGAYPIKTWDNDWELLIAWANQHEKYEFAQGDIDKMLGILEEHLNVMGKYALPDVKHDMQIDLLIPLRERSDWPDPLGYMVDSESRCGFKASIIEKDAFNLIGLADDGKYQIATDGRLELLQQASNPDTPIIVYHNIEAKFNICVDESAADTKKLRSIKGNFSMRTKKIPKKKYIQFEMPMKDMKNHTWEKFNPHNVVGKLGYQFDGSNGFFFVYNCREINTTDQNEDELFYCWMPVVPR